MSDGLEATTHSFLPWRCRYRHEDGRVETIWWHRADQINARMEGWYLDREEHLSYHEPGRPTTEGLCYAILTTPFTSLTNQGLVAMYAAILRRAVAGYDLHRRAMAFIELYHPAFFQTVMKEMFNPAGELHFYALKLPDLTPVSDTPNRS